MDALKIENPVAVGIVLLLVVGGILLLLAQKAAPPLEPITNAPALSSPVSKPGFSLAPEFVGISGVVNTDPGLTLASLRGKVVLVDFWTYSCINCIRTQPYLNAWYDKYADKGLVIVGVHTPEFDFEKKIENVQDAVAREEINYPVLLDNDYQTWRAYQNRYWPRKYLIDADGYIRYDHIGEGAYEETEAEIQKLLKERDDSLAIQGLVSDEVTSQQPASELNKIQTPEIYLGYQFARAPLGNEEGFSPEESVAYTLPSNITPDRVYLDGTWKNNPDNMELVSDTGKVVLTYSAKRVNIVAGAALPGVAVQSHLDDETPHAISIEEEKLYPVGESDTYDTRTLTLDVAGKGFQLYTFTFG